MPKPGVTRKDRSSDKQPLDYTTDSEANSSTAYASEEQAKRGDGKGKASRSPTNSRPKIRSNKKSQTSSLLNSASTATGKGQGSPDRKIGSAASFVRKSTFNDGSENDEQALLFREKDNSWESSEDQDLLQGEKKGKAIPRSDSASVRKSSKPVLQKSASSSAQSSAKKSSTVHPHNTTTGQESSVVKSSSEHASANPSNSAVRKQKVSDPAKAATADPASNNASKHKAASIFEKLEKRRTVGGFISIEEVEEQKAKAVKGTGQQQLQVLTPEKKALMDAHKADLIALMTAEDTDENAEYLYEKVAIICTDKKLKNWQKLECLRAEAGDVCKTLKQDVNAYFDACVIQHYVDNHSAYSVRESESDEENPSKNDGEKKHLISNNDDEYDGENVVKHKDVTSRSLAKYDEKHVLDQFKSTLSWWERRKLKKIKPEEKYRNDPVRRAALQRIELLRKMQSELTAAERQSIRENTKTYHDLLANSGLPVLHIAVKNESCKLVRAYLLAVMAFAPFDIKKEAIQATQHQGLQAFYWAMTHSTTDMIQMFMKTVLESDFLFYRDKEEILDARRPDLRKNVPLGISAFYMAMASGDVGRSDAFMSQLLAWDPNCRIYEYSDMKTNLLEASKSRNIDRTAKAAALKNGHKKLAKIYNQYIDSSHLRRIQKNILYKFIDSESLEEPSPKLTEDEKKDIEKLTDLVLKTLDIKTGGDLPEDVESMPGVPMQGYGRIHREIRVEREASLLELQGKPVPEHLQRFNQKDVALPPFKSLHQAGDYGKLSTIPAPQPAEKRRRTADAVIGSPPEPSKEAKLNSWEQRKLNQTLPPRSGSYASGLASLPPVPASMPALPRLDELSPVKLTPSPGRLSPQKTGLPNGTPTKFVTAKESQSPTSGSPPMKKKTPQKRHPSTKADGTDSSRSVSIPV